MRSFLQAFLALFVPEYVREAYRRQEALTSEYERQAAAHLDAVMRHNQDVGKAKKDASDCDSARRFGRQFV